ncbi:MAG: hypothetical protein KatS3mg098_010 [Candidatus Parcubacteria bacterium]|nr:MAG: hypothetical protein KatS3mg098_010 [Candidatus Parcubacteria bacterium]
MRKEKNIFGFLKTDFLNNKGQAVLMVVLVFGSYNVGYYYNCRIYLFGKD